jgi:hypothetical protein
VEAADIALALTALACLLLRSAGVWLAGGLGADHPVIAWATAIAQATLSAFVMLAIIAPSGALADVPSMPHPHLRTNNERQNMSKQTFITNEQLTHDFAHVKPDP